MRFRTPYWGAFCVLVCLLATGSLARAATISVPAGGNLQDALDAAKPGDVITLEPGATYVGNFVLPNKGATTDYITLRSAAPDPSLPPAGVRITPAFAAQLPKIKSSNNMAALRTATAAHHWKLQFLEFQANLAGYNEIISLGAGDSTQTLESQAPYELVIDRIYVHGDPLFGQKRCIALNGRDTVVVNSYVSECKAIGQDSQAIGGFNGPGNFRIENNYLEGATENVLIGGSDPTIPNLVTTGIVFRHNHLSKPISWRDPIVATPTGVSASVVAGGGSLGAGTYAYRVAARLTSNQNNKATSASAVEVSATIAAGTTGGVRVSWTAVAGAEQYLVYGRTPGGQTMYWKTSDTFFTDTGAAGTAAGTPSANEKPTFAGTKWSVKNIFELKNAQNVLVEGNVFEYVWIADQSGYPIVFTPRNQNGRAPWTIVQHVIFRHNLVRHTAGGVNILGVDNINPSQRTNDINISHNVFDDLSKEAWASGSRPFMIGDGPDNVTIDHNTVWSTDLQLVWLYGTPATNTFFTNNMAMHSSYGIMANGLAFGNDSINAFMPGTNNVTANVIAGGSASKYPAGNLFPTTAAWKAEFPNYATGDYHLRSGSPYKNSGLDGKDLGADIDTLEKHVAIALSGKDDGNPLTILPATLTDGKVNQPYAQSLSCAGAIGACVFSVRENALPTGLGFDATAGLISGVASQPGTGSIIIDAYDEAHRTASSTLSLKIAPADLTVALPASAGAQVGKVFAITSSVAGAVGATTWTVVNGALPPGIMLDAVSGAIGGVPTTAGAFTAAVTATDSWSEGPRTAPPATVTIAVTPADLSIDPTTLANGTVGTPYTATLTATGGTGSTIWSVKTGPLPDGMTLDASGVLSGTPTSAASFTFTVRATDAAAATFAEATMALTVDAPAPVAPPKGDREIVLYAADATRIAGTWSIVADPSAANGKRVWNKDNAAPKLTAALASPANYLELTFNPQAGVAYHLWLRGKADQNYWGNDSVYVQFSGSVNAAGAAVNRIGTTSAAAVSIEDGSNAGLSGWGWADDSYGGFAGPMYFATTGTQTVRIQVREDGLSLDQIVLSADRFALKAPGTTKNDTTILTTGTPVPTMAIAATALADATYGALYAATLSATGSTGSTVWSVLSGQLPAGMTLAANGALNGMPAALGDFSFTVQAQDADWNANVATAPMALKVVAPMFGVNPPAAAPAAMVGQPYTAGFTASGNVGNVVWSIASGELPAGLTLDAAAGTITGVPTMWGMFAVAVQGADSLGRTANATLSIVASPTPLAISTASLAQAAYKASYSATLTATGGTGALSWSVAGTLPAGITLDAASGVLSGTPTQAGTFVFDVRAIDTKWEGDTDTETITLLVQPPVFTAAVAPAAVSGRVGVALQPLAGSADGNVGDVKWSLASGTLPAGVALDAVSGRISGTPTAFGRFNADVKAEDSWGASRFVVSAVSIDVAPASLSVNPATLPAASVGKTYNYTLAATGGTGTTTWRVSSGTLPAGVVFGANGAFSGTPTAAGSFTFTVEASDAGWAGNIATKELTLKIGVREVVLYAAAANRVAGAWSLVADPTAAGSARLANPDAAAAKLTTPLANPASFFEVSFQAEAGVAYHLWLRGKADKNAWANDSVYVQFSGSVDAAGAPINRIGTAGAATVSIEDGTNAGLSGWGWADDSYGGFGNAMYFATTGTQTIRIQVREDGVSLDQIVLSADKYATVAPGATKNDTTILDR